MKSINRLKYHALRFRGELIFSSVILAAMMLMLVILFPGEEKILDYFGLIEQSGVEGLLGVIGGDAPAWVLWLGMQLGPYLYYVLVITAIRIGARLVPSTDDDGLELLLGSSPKPSRRFYLENLLAGIAALFIITLPAYLILMIFSAIQSSLEIMNRVTIIFLFVLGIAIVYMAITSLVAVLKFSKSTGLKVGFGYLIFSLLMEMSAPSLDEQRQKMVNMSFNYYLHPSSGIIDGEFNWMGLLVVLGISLVLFAISYWKLVVPDYNERTGEVKEKKTRFLFLPEFSPRGRLAQKFPLVFDQFRKDRSFVFIWTSLVVFMLTYITYMYQTMTPEQIADLFSTFDSPQAGALMQNHDLPATFLGFFAYQVLGMTWLWFGLFVLIISVNIVNRDVKKDTQDTLWANNLSQERVVIFRTIAMLIEFSLMYWIVALSIIGTALATVNDLSIMPIISTFVVGWVHYMAMGIFLVAITMVPRIDKGRKLGYWIFIIMVMVFLSAYSSPDAESMKYISLISYYDPIGILLGISSFSSALLQSLVLMIVSGITYVLVLKYKFKKHDLK